ncbi:hypothetical protein CRG98_008943 [Punica granatum]|uniref:Uncharacterized protein n=1 Tax=Punica granatum TaxID=22663 RepID=A0A2I0KQW2_PUNGR|nr:hypothetical protein CRG98_008943 [Punica granatum]
MNLEKLHLQDDEQQKAGATVECESFTFMSCFDFTCSSLHFFPNREGGASDSECTWRHRWTAGSSGKKGRGGFSGSAYWGRSSGKCRAKFRTVYRLLNVAVSSLKLALAKGKALGELSRAGEMVMGPTYDHVCRRNPKIEPRLLLFHTLTGSQCCAMR